MTSRLGKIVIFGVVGLVFLILGIELLDWFVERSMTRSWEKSLIGQLESIHSYDEAVLAESTILGDPEDEWIVLGYEDTHSGRILSVTVAKTKDGRWFESRRHFCGAINSGANANRSAAEYQALLDAHPADDTLPGVIEDAIETRDSDELWKIGKEPDQEKQVQMLIEAGFWEIDAP